MMRNKKSCIRLSFLLNRNIHTTISFLYPRIYIYICLATDIVTRRCQMLWTNMEDVMTRFVFLAFPHIGWRLYFIHAKKGMFDKCRGYFEVSSFRENRWTPLQKKRLGRQIVHKYACWRLRLFLCKITDAVFRIIEMKEMGLTFVQPLASSNTKYSAGVECVSNV